MNILTIVGARPQFVKAAPLSLALNSAGITQKIVHTGQHYDFAMSELFFQQLSIPKPAKFLGLGGSTHGRMTGDMLTAIEGLIIDDMPDAVLVYGDTNSTLAGALAAVKLHVPVIHIEAGLRSRNMRMPEEINRILTDRVSELLFCSSEEGSTNLRSEGITKGVSVCGDVMADAVFSVRKMLEQVDFADLITSNLPNLPKQFDLMTLHRAENTDNLERMKCISRGLAASSVPIIFPLHPRTRKMIDSYGIQLPDIVTTIDPVGYFEMCLLMKRCRKVVTDSGGLQKEAFWFGRPCITLRDETEWIETLEYGRNVLTGADSSAISSQLNVDAKGFDPPNVYGDGNSSVRITEVITKHFNYLQ